MFEFVDKLMSCGKKTLKIVIDGEPVVQARPRFGKGGRVYEPKKCTDQKVKIRTAAEQEMVKQGFAKAHKDMPIILNICFYKGVPTCKPRWWKAAARLGFVAPVSRTGDIDNLVKLAQDSINGIVFFDDAQICEVNAYARYSENPRTEIIIEALYTNVGEIKEAIKLNGTEAKQ